MGTGDLNTSDTQDTGLQPALYASPETLALMGQYVQGHILEWSNVEKGLLVIDRADFHNFLNRKYAGQYDLSQTADLERINDLNDQTKAALIQEYLQQHQGIPLTDFLDDETETEILNEFFKAAFNGEQAGLGFSFEEGRSRPEFGIIVVNSRESPVETAAKLSGISEDAVRNMAASPEDMRLFIFAHEAAHVRIHHVSDSFYVERDPVPEDLEHEIQSDAYGLMIYARALRDGAASSENLPKDMEGIRAIGSLIGEGDYFNRAMPTHATNAGFEVGEDGSVIRTRFNAAAIGAGILNVNALSDLLAGNLMADEFLQSASNRTSLAYALDYDDDLNTSGMTAAEASAVLAARVEAAKERILSDPGNEARIGDIILNEDPLLRYAAVKTLLDKGYFREGSEEHEIAQEFKEAMERHVPGIESADAVRNFTVKAENLPPAPERFRQVLNRADPWSIFYEDSRVRDSILRQADASMNMRTGA